MARSSAQNPASRRGSWQSIVTAHHRAGSSDTPSVSPHDERRTAPERRLPERRAVLASSARRYIVVGTGSIAVWTVIRLVVT